MITYGFIHSLCLKKKKLVRCCTLNNFLYREFFVKTRHQKRKNNPGGSKTNLTIQTHISCSISRAHLPRGVFCVRIEWHLGRRMTFGRNHLKITKGFHLWYLRQNGAVAPHNKAMFCVHKITFKSNENRKKTVSDQVADTAGGYCAFYNTTLLIVFLLHPPWMVC